MKPELDSSCMLPAPLSSEVVCFPKSHDYWVFHQVSKVRVKVSFIILTVNNSPILFVLFCRMNLVEVVFNFVTLAMVSKKISR